MLVIFNHLPKNGGTSIEDILKRNLGHRYAYYHTIDGSTPVDEIATILNQEQLICFKSHFVWPSQQMKQFVCSKGAFFSILRHPVERFKSFYFYSKYNNPNMAAHEQTRKLSLNDFCELYLQPPYSYYTMNTQALGLMMAHKANVNISNRSFLDFLQRFYFFVGTIEHIPQLLDELQSLGIVRETNVQHLNRSDRDGDELSEEYVERLERACAFDLALYGYIRDNGAYINRDLIKELKCGIRHSFRDQKRGNSHMKLPNRLDLTVTFRK